MRQAAGDKSSARVDRTLPIFNCDRGVENTEHSRLSVYKDYPRVSVAASTFMDSRVAWDSPEQLGKAQEQWRRLLETRLNNMQHNSTDVDTKTQEYISLDNSKYIDHTDIGDKHQHYINLKRKRDNRASTYGLNLSSQRHNLRAGPPWKPKGKIYHATVGYLLFSLLLVNLDYYLAYNCVSFKIKTGIIGLDRNRLIG